MKTILEIQNISKKFRIQHENQIIANETLGVGTRTEFAVNFPAKCGSTFFNALSAPVSVITIFKAVFKFARFLNFGVKKK